MASEDPPPYFRTVYDETLRSISYLEPSIMSMANHPTLLGQLENYSPTTDAVVVFGLHRRWSWGIH